MKKIYFVMFFLVVATIATAQNVLDIDLATLLREIENNPVRVSQQYEGRTIRVSGIISGMDGDSIYLRASNYSSNWPLYVYYNSSERSKVTNLNTRQRVTVRGVYDSSFMPSLVRAVIETNPLPSTSQQTQPQQQLQTQPQTAPAPTTQPAPTPAPATTNTLSGTYVNPQFTYITLTFSGNNWTYRDTEYNQTYNGTFSFSRKENRFILSTNRGGFVPPPVMKLMVVNENSFIDTMNRMWNKR